MSNRTYDSTLGTNWVAPHEGSTWRELTQAFGEPETELEADADQRTNLLLTGRPIIAPDRNRWESGNVR